MNKFPKKIDNLEQQYEEIFIILDKFIESHQNSKKDKQKILYLDKYSELFILFYLVLFSYSIILLTFKDFFQSQPNVFIILSICVLIIIAILAIISIILLFQEITSFKKFPRILLKNTYHKGIQELQFCKQLTQFDHLALEYTENRLKLLIENRKIGEQTINNLIPFLALGITGFSIYQYKPENVHNFNTLGSVIVVSGIITIILKGITELTDNKTIYQKCLAIVQYAKVLVDQSQATDDINYLPAKQQNNKDIMASLREMTIDQPSEFDHNS